MNSIQRLADLLAELPGIGPRQSKRIVYSLLGQRQNFITELSTLVAGIKDQVLECSSCHRFFQKDASGNLHCQICRDEHRDSSMLMIVSHDTDLDNMEKTRGYQGYYFVLGGVVPILDKEPEKSIRLNDLVRDIESRVYNNKLKEIIFALNANPEGENTQEFLEQYLAPLKEKHSLTLSALGRGLSTGSELEYADKSTLQNALKNRK